MRMQTSLIHTGSFYVSNFYVISIPHPLFPPSFAIYKVSFLIQRGSSLRQWFDSASVQHLLLHVVFKWDYC